MVPALGMSTSTSPDQRSAAPARSWGKRLLINLSLSACSLLLFVALLEVGLRILGYGRVELYEPDPVLYWKLKPNQKCFTKVNHQPVRINSQGTRGPEFDTAKPPGTLRIVCLGDSRTFGWGLSQEETYCGVLQNELQEHYGPKRRVEVINAGVNAWSFPQMMLYFRDRALKYNPDYVIVGDANFWTQFSEHNSPEFVRKFMRRVQLKNFLRRFALYHYFVEVQLSQVYERYRVKFVPVDPAQDTLFKEQQQKDPDAFFRNAIDQLCTIALTHQVTPILLYLPTEDDDTRHWQARLRQAKAQLSEKHKLQFVDLKPVLSGTDKKLYLEADPVHFNTEGNRIIAGQLARVLTNALALK
jgi:lysophospholipase L1-like esterase